MFINSIFAPETPAAQQGQAQGQQAQGSQGQQKSTAATTTNRRSGR